MGKLTASYVQRLKPTDKNKRYADGDGLSLMVRPNGSKAWQVRLINADGTKTDKGLGAFPAVRLAEARNMAKARRAQVVGQTVEIATSTVLTFRVVAEKYIEANAPTWKHHKTAENTRSRLENYAYPVFGDTPINQIRRAEV